MKHFLRLMIAGMALLICATPEAATSIDDLSYSIATDFCSAFFVKIQNMPTVTKEDIALLHACSYIYATNQTDCRKTNDCLSYDRWSQQHPSTHQ